MKTQSFSSNGNQRLILPVWQDVRLDDERIYQVGDVWQQKLKGAVLGTATLRAVVRFPFEKLTESCAHAVTGKGILYHRKMLMSYYPMLQPNSPMVFNTWEWETRDLLALSAMMKDYWNSHLKLAGVDSQELAMLE